MAIKSAVTDMGVTVRFSAIDDDGAKREFECEFKDCERVEGINKMFSNMDKAGWTRATIVSITPKAIFNFVEAE